jgi:hypothetical protein
MDIRLKLVKIAVLYMLSGLLMKLVMGISGNFTLTSVNAHTLMLGWATIALAGIVYLVIPGCSRSSLAKLHFLGHNLGLPVMMVSLALTAYGLGGAQKAITASSILVVASLALFAVNVVKNSRFTAE